MLNQRQAFTCPCCGGYIGEAAAPEHVAEFLPHGQQRTIFDLLAKKVGRNVPRDSIMFALYGDRYDGGPDYSDNIISVQIGRLRKSVSKFGWDVVGSNRGGTGNKGSYRLIPRECGP
jgi:hypothetical protein